MTSPQQLPLTPPATRCQPYVSVATFSFLVFSPLFLFILFYLCFLFVVVGCLWTFGKLLLSPVVPFSGPAGMTDSHSIRSILIHSAPYSQPLIISVATLSLNLLLPPLASAHLVNYSQNFTNYPAWIIIMCHHSGRNGCGEFKRKITATTTMQISRTRTTICR